MSDQIFKIKNGLMVDGDISYPIGNGDVLASGSLLGRLLNIREFISGSGTYTPTPGTRMILIYMVGGGGGTPQRASVAVGSANAAGSGGSGGFVRALVDVRGYSTGSYSVGAGGTAGTLGSSANSGGNTTFSIGPATLQANGGFGGTYSTTFILNTVSAASGNGGSGSATGSNVIYSKIQGGNKGEDSFGFYNGSGATFGYVSVHGPVISTYAMLFGSTSLSGQRARLANSSAASMLPVFPPPGGCGAGGSVYVNLSIATTVGSSTGSSGSGGSIFIEEYA